MNRIVQSHAFLSGQILHIVQGDLTTEEVGAIVNAANAQLQHDGGVARAIARRGGPQIQAESDAWVRQHGPVDPARPAVTSGGNLPCRYVIHAVGPIWGEGQEETKLAAAVGGALETAGRLELESIALPAISTGIYGYPKDQAARVILESIIQYLSQHPDSSLRWVRLTLFDSSTVEAFVRACNDHFGTEHAH